MDFKTYMSSKYLSEDNLPLNEGVVGFIKDMKHALQLSAILPTIIKATFDGNKKVSVAINKGLDTIDASKLSKNYKDIYRESFLAAVFDGLVPDGANYNDIKEKLNIDDDLFKEMKLAYNRRDK